MAALKRIERAASYEKELAGNLYSSMASKEMVEVRPWLYQYLRPIIIGITFCGVFAHEDAQCASWVKLHMIRWTVNLIMLNLQKQDLL